MRMVFVASGLGAMALLAGCKSTVTFHDAGESLSGLRIEVPCANPKFNQATECHWEAGLLQTADPAWKLKREIVRVFGGKATVTYSVTLRVRGVVEPKNFTGGLVQFDHFQAGGTPVKDDYNIYSVQVSDPQGTYTFNRNEAKVGHYTFPIDYQVTIPIRGGATVTMGAYDSNDVAIANHKQFIVVGVPPAPQPFDGQFFQLDVVSTVAGK